jgi:hypothetical protein
MIDFTRLLISKRPVVINFAPAEALSRPGSLIEMLIEV